MKNLIYPIILSIIMVVLYALVNKFKMNENRKKEKFTPDNFEADIHNYIFWIGLIGTLLFSIFLIISFIPKDKNHLFTMIIFGTLSLLGLFILIYSVRCRVIVKGDQMIITPFIGKIKSVKFIDITEVKIKTFGEARSYVIFAKNIKVLEIDNSTYTNYNLFIKKLIGEHLMNDSN